jgi:hypothetical protein
MGVVVVRRGRARTDEDVHHTITLTFCLLKATKLLEGKQDKQGHLKVTAL